MSTLTGNKISLTYKSLIKTADNDVLTAVLKELSDGLGNNSGVFLNTGGDLKSTGILEFANFKGTSTSVTINKLVNEADGISNNDNDTSLATSAAVKDYVDTHVTTQDLDFSDGTNPGAVDLDSQVFTIVGTSNEIETSASNQQLQIGLPNDVTISGTYTGTTFLGDLSGTINTATTATTQTAGDNSTKVATTAYVDTLDAASDLDFSDGTTNSAVNLNTQVFSVEGTSNEITTTASGQSLTVSLDSTGVDLPDNSTAITQTAGDNSTKVATTAYVDVLDSASDLDIAGDTGTGDVNLNTQTFTLSGTTNQVITSVSGQEATFSLSSTVHRNLQGNVTGDLTGNADTATAWETARDLILSSEATGTISNVDGTQNVTGAVTLLNSAVTGKVLTGLPTPAAGNIQSSDTILEAFGKLQSQVSSISNGLIFKGSWDAATNTPTLTSGGGEVDSGTTTGQTAFKLIETGQNFNTTVTIGDKVINQVDGTTALVTVIDSNTQLTLDADIMLSGEAYTIDASPFIPQGNYYVVNYAGTTNLNGITDWSIGDWVIADADNRWSKLDHSQVDGQGTPGHLPVFATATTIGDSIVAQSGTALTVTGSLSTTLGASVTGDFAVNTNKFTVAAASGNTVVAGTGTFNGDVTIDSSTATLNIKGSNTGASLINFADAADGNVGRIYYDHTDNFMQFKVNDVEKLRIDSSGYTKFTKSTGAVVASFYDGTYGVDLAATATGGSIQTFNTNQTLNLNTYGTGDITFTTSGTSERMRIDSSGNVGIGTDSPTSYYSGADNLVIKQDSGEGGMSIVTANDTSGALYFADGTSGNEQYRGGIGYTHSTDKLFLVSGGQTRVWMNDSGNVGIGTDSPDYPIDVNGIIRSKPRTQVANVSGKLILASDLNSVTQIGGIIGTISFTSDDSDHGADFEVGKIEVVNQNQFGLRNDMTFTTRGQADVAERMRIQWNGNVGIGTDSPDYKLSLRDDSTSAYPLSLENINIGTAGVHTGIRFGYAGNTYQKGAIIFESQDANGRGKMYFAMEGTANSSNADETDAKMTIDYGGNVGIGTDSPRSITNHTSLTINGTSVGRVDLSYGGTISASLYSNNSSTGLQTESALPLVFGSNNTERMRIDSSGLVEIKNTTPTLRLTNTQDPLGNGTVGILEFFTNDSSTGATRTVSSIVCDNQAGSSVPGGDLVFKTSLGGSGSPVATEKLRIKDNGNVGIATDTPSALLEIQTAGTSGNDDFQIFSRGESPNYEVFKISRAAGSTELLANQNLTLSADYDANHTSVDSNIIFKTDNAEKMRITSTGNIQSNNLGSGFTVGYGFQLSPQPGYSQIYMESNTTDTRSLQRFYNPNGNIGNIIISGFTTTYGTSSDYRLKEDLQDFAGLDMVSKIPVYDFKWKTDESRSYGVMAHELQEVLPDAVSGEKDAEEMQGVDYSKIVPLLVKSIQELKAEVDKLKQECKCK